MRNYIKYLLSKLPGFERDKQITLSAYAANAIGAQLTKVKNGDVMEVKDDEGLKILFIIKNDRK